jgi:hypothetical protein
VLLDHDMTQRAYTYCFRRLLFLAVSVLLVLVAPIDARAQERSAPNVVAFRLFAGPNEAGIGLAYQRDFVLPLRIGVAGGWFGAGDASSNWQSLDLALRLLEGSGGAATFLVPALFATAGVGRYYDEQRPDGHPSHRETFAANAGLVGELRPPQGSSSGLLLSAGVQGMVTLAQDIESNPYRDWEPYDVTVVGTVSLGYVF